MHCTFVQIQCAMRLFILIAILGCILLLSCKGDAPSTKVAENPELRKDEVTIPTISMVTFARLDRLRIRTDSTMTAGTVATISEGDTLIYLEKASENRVALQLRGKYYYEPWLNVRHLPSGKKGWVYGGAVKFKSSQLQKDLSESSPLMQQAMADDLEWDGTIPTGWNTATITDARDFKIFVIKFKELINNNDVSALAKMIRYPIKNIASPQEFKDNFTTIFSEELRRRISDQRLDQIFRNDQGASLGDGDIWFQQVDNEYKIVGLNFKGREDLVSELMRNLSKTYIAHSANSKMSIKAMNIKQFLEMTLDMQQEGDFAKRINLGRYTYQSSSAGRHTFIQDTDETDVRRAIFSQDSTGIDLQIMGGEPRLGGIVFVN